MSIRALNLSLLTYSNFGPHYPHACRLFGLEPTPSGYGLLLCVDDVGQRVTRATEDVGYAEMIASRVGTTTLERLEVPASKFPATRPGWPDDWTETHEGWVTQKGEAAKPGPAPDGRGSDSRE